jgi:hypothetical protein
MKQNHVLIDYENVQPTVADVLAAPVFKVWVFLGVQQIKVKVDLLDLVQRKGDDARIIKISSSGRNALDFHMSYYVGMLSTQQPDGYFHLIAKDTGMDPLIEHLKEKGISVARWSDVFDIPIVKAPAHVAEDDKLSRIMEYLLRRGRQRPASMKTLLGSISALFQPKLDATECASLIEELRGNGVLEIFGTKVTYGLPD